jgi:hypothetical protein
MYITSIYTINKHVYSTHIHNQCMLIVYMNVIYMYIDCVCGCYIHACWLCIWVLYTCLLMVYMEVIYMYIDYIYMGAMYMYIAFVYTFIAIIYTIDMHVYSTHAHHQYSQQPYTQSIYMYIEPITQSIYMYIAPIYKSNIHVHSTVYWYCIWVIYTCILTVCMGAIYMFIMLVYYLETLIGWKRVISRAIKSSIARTISCIVMTTTKK